jgi:hypothetical protein
MVSGSVVIQRSYVVRVTVSVYLWTGTWTRTFWGGAGLGRAAAGADVAGGPSEAYWAELGGPLHRPFTAPSRLFNPASPQRHVKPRGAGGHGQAREHCVAGGHSLERTRVVQDCAKRQTCKVLCVSTLALVSEHGSRAKEPMLGMAPWPPGLPPSDWTAHLMACIREAQRCGSAGPGPCSWSSRWRRTWRRRASRAAT